ncbi:hypothetical protein GGR58DRAFT_525990 [Xylaria digitata]|nr:hypothetical protein GGR58DRAFT_525990 [Xylaria digitata]
MIFGQDPSHRWPSHRNIGSGPDGKLTYAEFQARLQVLDITIPGKVDTNMKPPGSAGNGRPTISDSVQDLMKKGWNRQLDVGNIDPSLRGKEFATAEDPYNSAYNVLAERADKKFHQYRAANEGKWQRFLNDKNKVVQELLENINTLRTEDTNSFLYRQMQQTAGKPKYGLGLSADDISAIKDKASAVPNGRPYTKVDIAMTLSLGWADPNIRAKLQAAGFNELKDVLSWAENLGNASEDIPGPGYTDNNKGHFRALKTWKMALAKTKLDIASLTSCV